MTWTAPAPAMRTPRQGAVQRAREPRRLMLALMLLAGIFAMHGVQIVCGHMAGHTRYEAVSSARHPQVVPSGPQDKTSVAAPRQVGPDTAANTVHGRSAVTATVGPAERVHPRGSEPGPLPTDVGPVMGLCIAVLGGGVFLFGLLFRVGRGWAVCSASAMSVSAVVLSYLRSRRRRPRSLARTLSVLCVSRT